MRLYLGSGQAPNHALSLGLGQGGKMDILLILLGAVVYIIAGHFAGLLLLEYMENWQSLKKIWPQTKFSRFFWLEVISFAWAILVIALLLFGVSRAIYYFCKDLLFLEGKRFIKYGTTTISNEHEL